MRLGAAGLRSPLRPTANSSVAPLAVGGSTEVEVVGFSTPASAIRVVRFEVLGLLTNGPIGFTTTFRVRAGAEGLASPVVAQWTGAFGSLQTRTNAPFALTGLATFPTSRSAWGLLMLDLNAATAAPAPSNVVAAPVPVAASANIRVALTAVAGSSAVNWNVLSATVEVSI